MPTRLEQHGDVVVEIDISSTPIVRRRHTLKSALVGAFALALLLTSMWFRSRGHLLEAGGLLVAAFLIQWLGQRWLTEEQFPRPRTPAHKRTYRLLQGLEILGIAALLAWWFAWSDDFWIAAAGLVTGAVAGWWAIERAYRRLFEGISDELAAARP